MMYFVISFLLLYFTNEPNRLPLVYVVYWVVHDGGQALLTQRLTRKNYHSFRVYALREDGTRTRKLSLFEGLRVWLWIFAPQLA